MKHILIQDKLKNIGVDLVNLSLGDFDRIGEHCAKKMRSPSDPLYRSVGAYFRPNYERAILVYSLIRRYNLSSFLEIGTGRGYVTFCAAKAFHDMGIKGKITTIDPNSNEEFFTNLRQVFPHEWFQMVNFVHGTSTNVLKNGVLGDTSKYDLVYIDGDHSYLGTKADLENTKDLCKSFLLCDDYHLPSKDDPGIQCRQAIDEFDYASNGYSKPELIIGDRRIFFDDRRIPDDQINYGQCLFSKNEILKEEW